MTLARCPGDSLLVGTLSGHISQHLQDWKCRSYCDALRCIMTEILFLTGGTYGISCRFAFLEFVREKWNPVSPKRQTNTKEVRGCQVQSEPDSL
ncbi:hypothetical protein HGO34_05155 [Agrobacterium vitis]|uniref:Uncharacterized protein n=1 Tax=Agrobacterium vitis TaxID=373 RepID=A0AAE5AV33_AGRVI|nr:hypothetical protein [Agrobacterium vitis]MCF1497200.1 hypothetical protein [Allorhizobium sp. Av2]MCM2439106.1 hypothetical protein [Agrobacterium vitis]MUZ56617.1 hypothetical protein [Agrobacterium vitis]MVA65231.1 hypothetical protein [Agrobacterium vitis]MVA86246.1 hypothetical protein [Agrobacterium vitis]